MSCPVTFRYIKCPLLVTHSTSWTTVRPVFLLIFFYWSDNSPERVSLSLLYFSVCVQKWHSLNLHLHALFFYVHCKYIRIINKERLQFHKETAFRGTCSSFLLSLFTASKRTPCDPGPGLQVRNHLIELIVCWWHICHICYWYHLIIVIPQPVYE